MSLKEIVGWFAEPISPRQAGRLIVDLQDFGKPLSCKVAVSKQIVSTNGGFSTRLKILEDDFREESGWVQLYIGALWQELTGKIPQEYLDIISNNLVGIFDSEEVSTTLSQVLASKSLCFLILDVLENAVQVAFEGHERDTFVFKQLAPQPSEHLLKPCGQAFVFWSEGFRQYLVEGQLKASTPPQIIIADPLFLLCTSLRQEERTILEPGSMWVEIPLPYPRDAILRREIIDISTSGFSFKCPPDSSYFLPGTPLSHLKIVSEHSTPYSTSGQIRHVSLLKPESGHPYLKIGVQFQVSNKAFAKGHVQAQTTRKPSPRLKKEATKKRAVRDQVAHTLKRLMKSGLRLSHRPVISRQPQTGEEGQLFKYQNARNQEIVGLLNTTWPTAERRQCTTVVVPPPFGKRKEALGLFSHYLISRFREQRHDSAIVRFDTINTIGESYKDPPCRYPGKENLHMTLSQGTEDLLAILDFVENNEHFLAHEVVIVSFSLSALHARKAILKDNRSRVHLWIAPMGVTNMDDLMFNISGGIDYFSQFKAGKDLGHVTVLGVVVGGNRFCRDALALGYVSMDDAIGDMSKINLPVIWLYGKHDAWIDPGNVERLLESKGRGSKKVRILPTGHLPLNGEEAVHVFDVIFQELWPHMSPDPLSDFSPSIWELNEKQEREWHRVQRELVPSKKKYWATYLLGTHQNELGYDVLRYCSEYNQFIQDQIDHLEPEPGHLVADMGCGTGNFVLQYLERFQGDPKDFPRFTLVDIVSEALEQAGEKCRALAAGKGIADDCFQYCEVDLDLHPALPIRKFILGEYARLEQLKGQIPGLTDYSIDLWVREYGPRLHQILRGKNLTEQDSGYLDERFPEIEKQIILEFNRAANIIKRTLSPHVFGVPDSPESAQVIQKQSLSHLHLDWSRSDYRLPFSDQYFDRMVSSLLLPYLKNPIDTLAEFFRTLKPGGILVVSSMKPDTDMSKIYAQMIKRITSAEIDIPEPEREDILAATRHFANAAAHLLQLVEERRFRFFHPEELVDMAQACGLEEPSLFESYGDPPQAYILKVRK